MAGTWLPDATTPDDATDGTSEAAIAPDRLVDYLRKALREAKESLISSLEAERSAKATLDLAEGRYAAGVGDNLEISDAVDSYATASANRVLALYNCKTAQLDLEKAMGGLKYGE